MKELFRRLHYLLNRRRFDDDLAQEMEFHREMAAKNSGIPVGDSLRLREDSREAWGWMWIDRLGQDLRYAFRAMRSSPGFTLAAVMVLAIGIGATVAAFSAFNMVALRPLPIRDPETLLRFQRQGPENFWSDVPYPAVAFYAEHSRTLSAVLALATARLNIDGEATAPSAYFVTANFFPELGARSELGRLFEAADALDSSQPMVVLGYGFWAAHFGSSPAVVGSSIRLNGKATTVIGVASRRFSGFGSDEPAFWALITQQPLFVHGSHILTDFSGQRNSGVNMWGRLRPGVSARVAEEELASLAADLRKQHPDDVWEGERLPSEPGGYAQNIGSTSRGTTRPASRQERLYPMLGLVSALVLLILVVACGNLGSLLLARGAARGREISLRVAVGAGTGRVIRQLFTESLVLALMGALGGLALGTFILKGILIWTEGPSWFDITPDWRVVCFALGTGFLSAILFGLTPALHIAKQKTQMTFGRTILIGGQVASSCVLLIVAGLLVRAFDRVATSDPGFEYEHAIAIRPSLSEHGYTPSQARVYLDDLRTRLNGIPGVEAVSLSSTPPLGGARMVSRSRFDGRALDIYIHPVEPDYFATMKITLLRGQTLRLGDETGVVVSESLARARWPDDDPIGKLLDLGEPNPFIVVGVARNARSLALNDPDAVELYRNLPEDYLPDVTVLLRAAGSPEAITPAVLAAAKGIDPNVIPRVQLLKTMFRQRIADVERSALAVSLLGVIALLVACLGIVGLVAYAVSQRTKEIGIRMALGARPSDIVRGLTQQFQRTVIFGLVAGVGGAAALSQLLRRQLYGLSTLDPVSYIAAVALFSCAVAIAALLPARRALKINPLTALRVD